MPVEIGRYGFAGAAVLAHIRYRCATDGPDRHVADGVRWWWVSLADIAAELHVSKDVVQRAMKRLGDAVAAKRFGPPSDQTRAYHVAGDTACQNAESHRPDLPERDIAPVDTDRRGIAPVPTRNRTGTDAISRSVPIPGEGEEGGEGGGPGASSADAVRYPSPAKRESATADPFNYGDDPPEDYLHPFVEAAPAAAGPPTPNEVAAAAELPPPPKHGPQSFAEPEPSRYCPQHPGGTADRCPQCGDARKGHAAWDHRRQAFNGALRAARDAWIAACRECEDNDADSRCGGWVLDPWDELPAPLRCDHPRLRLAYAEATRASAFVVPSRSAS